MTSFKTSLRNTGWATQYLPDVWLSTNGLIHCESYNLQAGAKSPLTGAKRPQSGAKRPGSETSRWRNVQGRNSNVQWRGETSINPLVGLPSQSVSGQHRKVAAGPRHSIVRQRFWSILDTNLRTKTEGVREDTRIQARDNAQFSAAFIMTDDWRHHAVLFLCPSVKCLRVMTSRLSLLPECMDAAGGMYLAAYRRVYDERSRSSSSKVDVR